MNNYKTSLTVLEKDLDNTIFSMLTDSSRFVVGNIGWNRTDREQEAIVSSIFTAHSKDMNKIWDQYLPGNRIYIFFDRNPERRASNFRESFPMKRNFKPNLATEPQKLP